MKKEYTEAAEKLADNPKTILAAIDCGKHNELCQENNIPTIPYIIYWSHLKDKQPFSGKMSADNFVSFIKKMDGQEEQKVADTPAQKPTHMYVLFLKREEPLCLAPRRRLGSISMRM